MKQILLVDDDADMVKMTTRWLEKAGYQVICALSGREALSVLEKSVPDLILLDFAMPEMDGPEVLEAIRKLEGLKEVPVLFRTGKDDETAREVLDRLKPDGVVSKAEGRAALIEELEEVL